MKKLRVLLVRHGESEANRNQEIGKRKADHAVELTEEGNAQAKACGSFLAKYLVTCGEGEVFEAVRLWHSPYRRTRQTAARIMETARLPHRVNMVADQFDAQLNHSREAGESIFWDKREHLGLHEQLFGVFDGLSDEERAEQYPTEWAHYQKCKEFEGKVWARHPGGESRVDVALRLHSGFFGTVQRDFDRHKVNTIVVVAHGTVNRAFTQQWCHFGWEFLEKEPNPRNCSVRLLEDGKDQGYIFDGY